MATWKHGIPVSPKPSDRQEGKEKKKKYNKKQNQVEQQSD